MQKVEKTLGKIIKSILNKLAILFETLKINCFIRIPRYWISNNELLLYHLMCFHYIIAEKIILKLNV